MLLDGSDANTLAMLQLKLSDRVALRYEDIGVNGAFFIEGHTLLVTRGDRRFERALLLRQA
jgi:hypothetical protein